MSIDRQGLPRGLRGLSWETFSLGKRSSSPQLSRIQSNQSLLTLLLPTGVALQTLSCRFSCLRKAGPELFLWSYFFRAPLAGLALLPTAPSSLPLGCLGPLALGQVCWWELTGSEQPS